MTNYNLLTGQNTFEVTWNDGQFTIFICGDWYFSSYDDKMEFAEIDIFITSSTIYNDYTDFIEVDYVYSGRFSEDLRLQIEEEVNTDLMSYEIGAFIEKEEEDAYNFNCEL